VRRLKYFLGHVTSERDYQTLLLFVISDSDPDRLDSEVGSDVMDFAVFERLNPLITERTPRGKLVQISAAEFERLRGAQIEKVSIPSLELWWVKE